VCPEDFPHIFQEVKENMAIVLRNLLTDAPRVIVRKTLPVSSRDLKLGDEVEKYSSVCESPR